MLSRIAKGIVLVLILLCLASTAFAQSADMSKAYERWPSALGVFFSRLAGNPGGGLHYQHWLGPLGLSITGGGLYSPKAMGYVSILDYSIMAGAQYRVFGDDFAEWFSGQLYFWGEAGHIGYIKSAISPFIADAVAGFGIGIETIWFDHFSFPLEFGYAAQFPIEISIQFCFGGGLRYRY